MRQTQRHRDRQADDTERDIFIVKEVKQTQRHRDRQVDDTATDIYSQRNETDSEI